MEGAPPVANQIDLFMHFLGASEDGLVKRPVEMDKISSSVALRLLPQVLARDTLDKKMMWIINEGIHSNIINVKHVVHV